MKIVHDQLPLGRATISPVAYQGSYSATLPLLQATNAWSTISLPHMQIIMSHTMIAWKAWRLPHVEAIFTPFVIFCTVLVSIIFIPNQRAHTIQSLTAIHPISESVSVKHWNHRRIMVGHRPQRDNWVRWQWFRLDNMMLLKVTAAAC